ncbi:MAG TPA: hypothetical protein VIM11_02720 [Tepidisphaeraceae bacterium]
MIGEEIQPTGLTISTTAGTAFSGTLATFVIFDDAPANSVFVATIDWGDGHTSTATVKKTKKNTYSVIGSYTYMTAGTYQPPER